MNWLESLLYGIISGITEFLPISTLAHQHLFFKMLDISGADPLQSLLIHIALIAAVLTACKGTLEQFYRAKQTYRKDHKRMPGSNINMELRFLKRTIFPMLLSYFLVKQFVPIRASLVWIAVFSFLNFLILIFQTRMMQGNKDERNVNVVDSLTIGIAASAGALPGISRVCAMLTVATQQGIDKEKAINWIVLLSAPMLALLGVIDILNLITVYDSIAFSANLPGYILSTVGAFVSGYLGILLIKSYAYRKDISDFAYYSLGVMFFALFLYLTVV